MNCAWHDIGFYFVRSKSLREVVSNPLILQDHDLSLCSLLTACESWSWVFPEQDIFDTDWQCISEQKCHRMSQILANVSTMNRFGPEYSTPDISCSKETAVRLKALKLHPTFSLTRSYLSYSCGSFQDNLWKRRTICITGLSRTLNIVPIVFHISFKIKTLSFAVFHVLCDFWWYNEPVVSVHSLSCDEKLLNKFQLSTCTFAISWVSYLQKAALIFTLFLFSPFSWRLRSIWCCFRF